VETKAGQSVGSSFTLFADQVSTAAEDDNGGSKKLASAGGRP
jgi:hypothetical protein